MIKLNNISVEEVTEDQSGEAMRELFGVTLEELDSTVKRLGIFNDLSTASLQKVLDDTEVSDNVKLWFVFALGTEVGTNAAIDSMVEKLSFQVFRKPLDN